MGYQLHLNFDLERYQTADILDDGLFPPDSRFLGARRVSQSRALRGVLCKRKKE